MELRHVRSFVGLSNELHFGRTAAALNLSPPALSQHIKLLERDLHVQLFTRDRRSVQLTEAGLAFLPHAKRLIATADTALSDMRSHAGGLAGVLRVGLFVNNAAELTLPILQRFRAAYPEVQLNFVPLDFAGQVNGFLDDKVDVAFVRPPIRHHEVDVRVLGREPRVAVVSASSDLADADSITIEELAERRFIEASAIPMPAAWTQFWLMLNERNESIPSANTSYRLADFDAVALDIALNDTVTTVPSSIMRESGDGRIRGVAIEGLDCEIAIATHRDTSSLASHFCLIAEETAQDLLGLVPGAMPALH